MSGGSWEYVMGNMSSTADSYTFYPMNSEFVSSWYNNYSNQKYVNTYANVSSSSYSTTQTGYNAARLGDATGEVVLSSGSGWYSDRAFFPCLGSSWFKRGGTYSSSSSAGVFNFGYEGGGADGFYSARAALLWFVF